MITLLPLGIVIALCILFFFLPKQSNAVLSQIRFFFGDTFGTYYLVIGLESYLVPVHSRFQIGNIVRRRTRRKAKVFFLCMGIL